MKNWVYKILIVFIASLFGVELFAQHNVIKDDTITLECLSDEQSIAFPNCIQYNYKISNIDIKGQNLKIRITYDLDKIILNLNPHENKQSDENYDNDAIVPMILIDNIVFVTNQNLNKEHVLYIEKGTTKLFSVLIPDQLINNSTDDAPIKIDLFPENRPKVQKSLEFPKKNNLNKNLAH